MFVSHPPLSTTLACECFFTRVVGAEHLGRIGQLLCFPHQSQSTSLRRRRLARAHGSKTATSGYRTQHTDVQSPLAHNLWSGSHHAGNGVCRLLVRTLQSCHRNARSCCEQTFGEQQELTQFTKSVQANTGLRPSPQFLAVCKHHKVTSTSVVCNVRRETLRTLARSHSLLASDNISSRMFDFPVNVEIP